VGETTYITITRHQFAVLIPAQ